MRTLTLAVMAFIMFAISPANAGPDTGLYDPLPPAGSAFVRFIHAGTAGDVDFMLNGKTIASGNRGTVTSYYALKAGSMTAQIAGQSGDQPVEAGKFYTVLATPDALRWLADEANENRAKAQIVFYNASGVSAILKTADGAVDVVPEIAAGASAARQINPVKVDLAVFEGTQKKSALEPVSLDRGASYAALYLGAGEPVVWVRSTTKTTQ